MKQTGAYGVGQSSWGPAIYAVVKQEQAKPTLAKVKKYLLEHSGGDVFVAKANNHGATIKVIED
jgi:beta-ribofuranosylaminobenzene 5'-phosphate synthase